VLLAAAVVACWCRCSSHATLHLYSVRALAAQEYTAVAECRLASTPPYPGPASCSSTGWAPRITQPILLDLHSNMAKLKQACRDAFRRLEDKLADPDPVTDVTRQAVELLRAARARAADPAPGV